MKQLNHPQLLASFPLASFGPHLVQVNEGLLSKLLSLELLLNYLNSIDDLVNHFEVDPVVVGELVDRRWHERILWGIPLPNQSFLVDIKRIHMRIQTPPPGFHDTLDRSNFETQHQRL